MEAKLPLTLVIPTYNEETRLPRTLQILADWIPTSCFDVEVIIVDDGSADRTKQVAESYQDRVPLRFMEIEHRGNMHAIITGLQASTRDLRATLEADCPVHPRLFEEFAKDNKDFDIVTGRRVKGSVEGKPLIRRFLSAAMSLLFRLLFTAEVHDPQIGFKLFKADVLNKVLPLLSLRHDGIKSTEIIVKAVALGYRVKEVPVHYVHDADSRTVPTGNFRVPLAAAVAVLQLWELSYFEFKRGVLPTCPVQFGFLLPPFRLVSHIFGKIARHGETPVARQPL